MTTCFLAPDPLQSTFLIPGTATPGNGVQVFFYQAGTSTKQTAYKDNTASAAHTNPMILDSGGNPPSGSDVWFVQGQTYKVVYAPSNDTDPPASPYRTLDNLSGINDLSSQVGFEWIQAPVATFANGTSFVLSGDYTSSGAADVGRRVKASVTAGTYYGRIQSRSVSSGSTTVQVVREAGATALDSGLSGLNWGLLTAKNPSYPVLLGSRANLMDATDNTKIAQFDLSGITASTAVTMYASQAGIIEGNRTSTSATSSGVLDLDSISGDYVHIASTNDVFQITLTQGRQRTIIADNGFTLRYSATSIAIPGGISVSANPGDTFTVRGDSSAIAQVVSYATLSQSQIYFLGATTVSSTSPQTTVVFTNLQGYNFLKFYLKNISQEVASSTSVYMQMSSTNGANWIEGGFYQFALDAKGSNGTNYPQATTNSTSIPFSNVSSNGINGGPLNGLCAEVTLYPISSVPAGVSVNIPVVFTGTYAGFAVDPTWVSGVGSVNSQTTTITAVRFFCSPARIKAGQFSCYGIKT